MNTNGRQIESLASVPVHHIMLCMYQTTCNVLSLQLRTSGSAYTESGSWYKGNRTQNSIDYAIISLDIVSIVVHMWEGSRLSIPTGVWVSNKWILCRSIKLTSLVWIYSSYITNESSRPRKERIPEAHFHKNVHLFPRYIGCYWKVFRVVLNGIIEKSTTAPSQHSNFYKGHYLHVWLFCREGKVQALQEILLAGN